jgi:hypothetical protein
MTAEVKLIRLECHRTEDSGNDEIYMNFNGSRVFGIQTFLPGQTHDISRFETIDGQAFVALQEEDDIDSDDFLGSIVIHESELNQGLRTQDFTLDDAHYTLFYRVVPAD